MIDLKENNRSVVGHGTAGDVGFDMSANVLNRLHYTTNEDICQDLEEKSEIEKKFVPKRLDSEKLADSFKRLDYIKRAERVMECGTYLEFAHAIDSSGVIDAKGKLHNANFCRDRLCPMCSWRRSYKIFAQISQIMRLIADDYSFIFLTLTVPNCGSDSLIDTLDKLNNGWKMLMRNKKVKKVVKGYFRALEITKEKSRLDYWHPHFHCIIAVHKTYFKSRDYIKQSEWLQMWRDAYGDETITQVDIRKAVNRDNADAEQSAKDLEKAVAEVAKYAVKSTDYLRESDSMTDLFVDVLAKALHGRRLVTFDRNGVFADARNKLKLDDAEDGDLIHIDDDKIEPAVAYLICRYGWSVGAYSMTHSYIKEIN